jgi:ABC-type nitrate/sulfonate/bicarbonate transport system substrate-binding protein
LTLTSHERTAASPAITELWYTRCPVPTASSIAISQGWLDQEFATDEISVSSLRASTDRSVRESHFDHQQANSFRQGGNIPPIWTRSRGNELRLIGLSWVDQYQAILALPESRIHTAADLKGKRLGVTRRVNDQIDFYRATALHGYEAALSTVGLTLDDVKIVELPVTQTYLGSDATSQTGSLFGAQSNRRLQSREVLALARGEVDAIYSAGGRGPDLEALLGAQVVFDIQRQSDPALKANNITPATLTVSGRLLEERPDLVVRYIVATLRAAAWAQAHPAETTRIIAHEIGIAEDFVEPGYPGGIHSLLTPSLDANLIAAIESQKNFLLRHGFIERDFDVAAWVAPEPLREALRIFAASSGAELAAR